METVRDLTVGDKEYFCSVLFTLGLNYGNALLSEVPPRVNSVALNKNAKGKLLIVHIIVIPYFPEEWN